MSSTPEIQVPAPRVSGFTTILLATVVAGVLSYFVTWLVPHQIGLARYAVFAVVWSAIYLVVGALSGIQQEVTRATRRLEPGAPDQVSRARNFGIAVGAGVFVVVAASSPLWSASVFPRGETNLVWPLAVATGSYVFVAVLGGTLYGLSDWRMLALMISGDAILRLIAVGVALVFTKDVVALAWAVAAPFPLTLAILWPVFRNRVVGRTQLDVGYRALSWNVARTVIAAAATAVMVSGFPLLLGVTSTNVARPLVGLFILTITLSRAPLIVVTMSLQSYFVVLFRDRASHLWRLFLSIAGLIFAAAAIFATVGWLVGPDVFGLLFPGELKPQGWLIAVLLASSALVGTLCVSGPAVLSRSQHFAYSAGWVFAALVTIAVLVLPLDFTLRTVLALVLGPAAGLAVHAGYLVAARLRDNRSAAISS